MILNPAVKLPARSVYLAYCAVTSLGFALMFTAASVYRVTVAGLDPFQLVLVGTALELSCLVFEVPTGVVADTISRRASVLAGVTLLGASFALEASFPAFAPILAAQVVSGLGYTFVSGALDAWLADEAGEDELGPLLMRGAQAGQVGALAGIAASAWLGSARLSVPMLLGAALFVALAACLARFMPETAFRAAAGDARPSWAGAAATFRGGVREVRGRPVLMLLLGVAAFWGMSSEAYDRLVEAHVIANVGFPAWPALTPVAWFAAISVAGLVLGFVAVEFARRRLHTGDQRGAARVLAAITVLLAAGVTAFALAHGFAVAAAAVLAVGLLRRVHAPIFAAFVNRGLNPRSRATVLSFQSQADAFGQVLGGPALGWIAAAASVRHALLAGAVMLLPAVALYARARRVFDDDDAAVVAADATA